MGRLPQKKKEQKNENPEPSNQQEKQDSSQSHGGELTSKLRSAKGKNSSLNNSKSMIEEEANDHPVKDAKTTTKTQLLEAARPTELPGIKDASEKKKVGDSQIPMKKGHERETEEMLTKRQPADISGAEPIKNSSPRKLLVTDKTIMPVEVETPKIDHKSKSAPPIEMFKTVASKITPETLTGVPPNTPKGTSNQLPPQPPPTPTSISSALNKPRPKAMTLMDNDEEDELEKMMKKNKKPSVNESSNSCPKLETTPQRFSYKSEDFVKERKDSVEDNYYFTKPPLGSGLYGTVYKAKHKKTGVLRAIKRIKKTQPDAKTQEMKKDIEVLKRLDHPNIVKVYESYEDECAYYIVTDLCTGGDLFSSIEKERVFNERKAADFMRQVLSAIAYCHEHSIAHRDLKPENIMLEGPEGKNLLKLIDFGNSAYFKPGQFMTEKFGTAFYVAPEVLKGSYTEKCDVWSLGVVLFIILSGYPPFDGPDDNTILKKVFEGSYSMATPEWKTVSDDAKDLVKKMLVMNPKDRISARGCLEHKWIKEQGKAEDLKFNQAIDRRTLRNLKTFQAKSTLQEAILYFIVDQISTQDERGDMMNVFMSLDTENTGKLTRSDLIKAYIKMGEDPETVAELVDEILKNLGEEGKGEIDFSKYVTAAMSKRKLLSEDRLMKAFNLFDTEERGFITVDNIKSALNGGEFKNLEQNQWTGLIEEVARGQDKIDFESFKQMMNRFKENEKITQSLAI